MKWSVLAEEREYVEEGPEESTRGEGGSEEVTDVKDRSLVLLEGFLDSPFDRDEWARMSRHTWCVCILEENCIFSEGTKVHTSRKDLHTQCNSIRFQVVPAGMYQKHQWVPIAN